MEKLLQYALTGLAAGSLYALVALGVVLIYRSTRVLNFAHGDIATLATFVAFSLLSNGYSFPLALTVSLIVGAAVGVAFYFGVLVKAQREGANLLGMVILTLGLALIIQGAVVWWWGAEPVSLPFPISDTKTYRLGPVVVSQLAIATNRTTAYATSPSTSRRGRTCANGHGATARSTGRYSAGQSTSAPTVRPATAMP